jgi:hypothetical protein
MRARTIVVACSLVGALSCTKTLDSGGLEDQIKTLIQERGGPTLTSVSCPDDVQAQAGGTFTCTATDDAKTYTIEVTQTDDKGNVSIRIVNAA